MSRRHTSNQLNLRLGRVLAPVLLAVLAITAALPAAVSAQSDQDVDQLWQVLTYLDRNTDPRKPGPVPAGVNAMLLMHSGSVAVGEAACSSYETTYSRPGPRTLFIDPATPEFVPCDPFSEAFDRTFYQLLEETASFDVDDSILTLRNAVGDELMVLTRAKIADDPTVARWDLLRLGAADGSVEPVIDGLNPWVEFLRGGRIVGDTGCGSFLGWYDTNEGTMQISEVHDRLGACTEGARRQAETIVDTLPEIATFKVLPAGLALKDENGVTRLGLEPEIELGGRTWTPTAILDDRGSVLRTSEQLTTSAVSFKDRNAEGVTICRPFTAESLRSGLALSLDDDTIDYLGNKPCRANNKVDLPGVEKDFVDALKGSASHALRGNELELRDVDGNVLMRLEPQSDLLDITWHVTKLGSKRLAAPVGDDPLTVNFSQYGTIEGLTGAVDAADVPNRFLEFYELPQAAIIKIDPIERIDIDGKACNGRARNKDECKQEQAFVDLLSSVDGYIVLDNELRLRQGLRTVMTLTPEYLIGAGQP